MEVKIHGYRMFAEVSNIWTRTQLDNVNQLEKLEAAKATLGSIFTDITRPYLVLLSLTWP